MIQGHRQRTNKQYQREGMQTNTKDKQQEEEPIWLRGSKLAAGSP